MDKECSRQSERDRLGKKVGETACSGLYGKQQDNNYQHNVMVEIILLNFLNVETLCILAWGTTLLKLCLMHIRFE